MFGETEGKEKANCKRCGGSAWYLTKVTLWEAFAFMLGWYKPADYSPIVGVDAQLGGTPEQVNASWQAAKEKSK